MNDIENNEKLIEILQDELEWVKYRLHMLDVIEAKLLEMRQKAKFAAENGLDKEEIDAIQSSINDLLMQINALDDESRKNLMLLEEF